MGLHITDGRRLHTCVRAGRAHHVPLRLRIGRHQAGGAAVGVDRRPADDRQHAVAVAPGVAEPLEHHHPAALAAHHAVRRCVERPARPIRRRASASVEGDGDRGGQQHVHSPGQRGVALARSQGTDGRVHRHQRGGARGVDGHAGPAQVQQVGEPVGDDAQRGSRRAPPLDPGEIAHGQVPVLGRGRPDEHAGAATAQPRRRDRGVFQRLPRDLQQDALLRVHRPGLGPGDAEELGVEAVDLVEVPAAPRSAGEDPGHIRRAVVVVVPPALGHLADSVPALLQQGAEVGDAGRAGKAAAGADDGDSGMARVPFPFPRRGGGPLRVPRGLTAGQGIAEPVDGGVLPEQGGRQRVPGHLLQLARDGDGVRGGHTVVRQRQVGSHLAGVEPVLFGDALDENVPHNSGVIRPRAGSSRI